ncbi:MAG: hypothetical protein II038_10895 [Lachnospiraceae bacterium]|nr:hypothetical protein [Lachnospiraceae bacterium]
MELEPPKGWRGNIPSGLFIMRAMMRRIKALDTAMEKHLRKKTKRKRRKNGSAGGILTESKLTL